MATETALGIDVGGSGIKGAVVDMSSGEFVGERIRIPTPTGFAPDEIILVIAQVIKELNHNGPVGIGFPAVVRSGVVATPPTALAYPGWVGVDLAAEISRRVGAGAGPVSVVNDADAAGTAEVMLGAGKGRAGTVVVLTLGTGIGSATFVDGKLLPNTEFGRLYLGEPQTAEHMASDRVRKEHDLSWKQWAQRLERLLQHLELLVAPDLIVIGGGVSKKSAKYLPRITTRVEVVPAQMLNHAGIVGAAASSI